MGPKVLCSGEPDPEGSEACGCAIRPDGTLSARFGARPPSAPSCGVATGPIAGVCGGKGGGDGERVGSPQPARDMGGGGYIGVTAVPCGEGTWGDRCIGI